MKIYHYIKFDLDGNVIEEDFFEYSNAIALCKTKAPPGPSPAEDELTRMQTELLRTQIEQLDRQNQLMEDMWPQLEEYYSGQIDYAQLQLESAQLLLPLQTELAEQGIELNSLQLDAIKSETERNTALEPVLLEAMGYEKDESGNYVAIEGEQDPLLATLKERYTGAIEGKEGGSPYLEKQLGDERTKLEEDLSRRLGPDWQTSTSGIQAMSDFDTRADLLRTEEQQSTIASAGSQYLSARGLLAGEQQQKVSNISSLMGGGTSGVTPTGTIGGGGGGGIPSGLMGGGGGGSSASAGISDLRNYYQTNRYNQWAAKEGQSA